MQYASKLHSKQHLKVTVLEFIGNITGLPLLIMGFYRIIPLWCTRRYYKHWFDFEWGLSVGLKIADLSNRIIIYNFGWRDIVVPRCWNQGNTDGTTIRDCGSGRPQVLNMWEDWAIRKSATYTKRMSLSFILRHLLVQMDGVISNNTILRWYDS